MLVATAAAAGFATLIAYPHGNAAVVSPPAQATAFKWVDAAATDDIFTLESPMVDGLARTYTVDRRPSGSGREDVMTFGTPGADRGYVRLEIRHAMASTPDSGLFVALVRRAAQAGLAITRAGQSFALPTRLGPFDASDVTLAADAHEWACLGLRLRTTDTRLQITGLACGEAGKRPATVGVACMLDALDLAPDAYDPPLRGFFQEAERRRGSLCKKPPSRPGLSLAEPPTETPVAPMPSARKHPGRHRSPTFL